MRDHSKWGRPPVTFTVTFFLNDDDGEEINISISEFAESSRPYHFFAIYFKLFRWYFLKLFFILFSSFISVVLLTLSLSFFLSLTLSGMLDSQLK